MKQTVPASQPLAAAPHGAPHGTRLGTENGGTASRRGHTLGLPPAASVTPVLRGESRFRGAA